MDRKQNSHFFSGWNWMRPFQRSLPAAGIRLCVLLGQHNVVPAASRTFVERTLIDRKVENTASRIPSVLRKSSRHVEFCNGLYIDE
jgi:hypothetical protein